MVFSLKSKIWLTVFSIVILFTFFTLFYFPAQQEKLSRKNYENEVHNLAKTVALGVKIAYEEENMEAVDTAMQFVKDDPRLQFVCFVKFDTVWNHSHESYYVKKEIQSTFPKDQHPDPEIKTNESIIVKRGKINTSRVKGLILLGFNTKDINKSKKEIRTASLWVSSFVLLIGILLGLLLARKISVPVLALRDAAKRVGEGDLSQKVSKISNDEIGELGRAFNHMVDELGMARLELNEKNTALSSTNTALNNTLLELKTTQTQLIQSEKMASLGELTAGIAHEIQNPLNFINNFSDINTELIDELKKEIIAGNTDEVIEIADNIKQNQEKITHHGKRADGIVKGMLMHSRKSTGQKELTDINELADEYLRLSYHGLRAKDKSFNATLDTKFDPNLEKINIVQQDIGRVILNLFTNAFYSVGEKKKIMPEGYSPTVTVTTKKITSSINNSLIELRIRDNGMGIPQKIIDKIFQPFFTTKPTGQGTGLGLSLSYDIIKAHNGEFNVETKEGDYAEFIIHLPV